MSKRDTGGAFDALIHAIAGMGEGSSWTQLPPPTAPGSLGRALGQGVLHARLARGTNGATCVEASPVPAEQMPHEGQRSVAELGTVLWRAMEGQRDAPELERWLAPPHTDSIVALTLTRRHLAEYAVPEAIDRNCAFPGQRVWLVEIERAKGDVPSGIAVWRSRGAHGEWRTRCACVWTHGRIGSPTHPLVIGAQWDGEANEVNAGACVIGPSWEDATRAAKDASREAVLARRRNAIGSQMMARIVIPAMFAWLDRHAGTARPAGRFGAEEGRKAGDRATLGQRARTVHPVAAAARTPPPAWLGAGVERAVEAIVIAVACEGFRVGASCPVAQWRTGWAGYAEMGAIAWYAIGDPKVAIDSERWRAMERALRDDGLAARRAHPALEAMSALVRKMLEQTGRNHVARAPDERTLCALAVPARLWRALGEAGPCPLPLPAPSLSERWWFVEIEHPAGDEPNAIALWDEDGAEVALAAFLGVDDGNGGSCLTVVTWSTTPDGERSRAGVAAFKSPLHVDNPHNAESRAGTEHVIETLAAPESGALARAKAAIAVHLASNGRAMPLGSYRPSARSAWVRGEEGLAGQASITELFALERAPEPEMARDGPAAEGHPLGGGGRMSARHHVRAHWKRQAFGPRLAHRRLIVVEGYARGPEPQADQIVMTRLAEREPRANDNTQDEAH